MQTDPMKALKAQVNVIRKSVHLVFFAVFTCLTIPCFICGLLYALFNS